MQHKHATKLYCKNCVNVNVRDDSSACLTISPTPPFPTDYGLDDRNFDTWQRNSDQCLKVKSKRCPYTLHEDICQSKEGMAPPFL